MEKKLEQFTPQFFPPKKIYMEKNKKIPIKIKIRALYSTNFFIVNFFL